MTTSLPMSPSCSTDLRVGRGTKQEGCQQRGSAAVTNAESAGLLSPPSVAVEALICIRLGRRED